MKRKRAEAETLTCRCVGPYGDALTRGTVYTAETYDPDKRQFRLCGDNGRSRWFPAYLFERGEVTLPRLSRFEISTDLEDAEDICLEVLVTLTTGERRWCLFATPSALSASGDLLEGTDARYHHGPHLIVATSLSKMIVGGILQEIDDQDQLVSVTLPIEPDG